MILNYVIGVVVLGLLIDMADLGRIVRWRKS